MDNRAYVQRGTESPWYQGWDLTDEERATFRATTLAAQEAKRKALRGEAEGPRHPINYPRLDPLELMPLEPKHGLRALSLFSGGGGLDIGFDRAGYQHVASYELLSSAAAAISKARPEWTVFGGDAGDVTRVDWAAWRNKVDVLHGGPPCQPFSHAGRRKGAGDARDMIPALVKAVREIRPQAFVCENVSGLITKRFEPYIQSTIYAPLAGEYHLQQFCLEAADFGVPQRRKRVFFVGFRDKAAWKNFRPPAATHAQTPAVGNDLAPTMGARAALGLPEIGVDGLAPTLRSGFTGPRFTTSVLSSVSAQKIWSSLQIWPNGVSPTRDQASAYPTKNGHFRLSVPDCLVLQGFPGDWPVGTTVYVALGLIGNSVAPPMGYRLAQAVRQALN